MPERTRKLIRFAMLAALFVWSALAYGELGKYIQNGTLFARIIGGRPYISDFANHYSAGKLAARCLSEKTNIYDPDVQNQSLKSIIAPIEPEEPFYLQYPPYFFVMNMAITFIPITWAWLLSNLTWIVLSLFALLNLSSPSSAEQSREESEMPQTSLSWTGEQAAFSLEGKEDVLMLLALTFSSYPAWLSVELGQTSLLLLACAAFMLHSLRKRRNFLAGIACAFLTVKLQYAPFFLVLGLFRGRGKFALGWIISMSIFLAASLAVLGVDNVMNYPKALLSGETSRALSGVSAFMMQNVRGALSLLFADERASAVLYGTLLFYALGIIAAGWLGKRSASSSSETFKNTADALLIMLAILTSPHTHVQDYLILSISAVLVLPQFFEKSFSRIKNLFAAAPALSWLFFYLQPFLLLLRIQSYFLYLLFISLLLFGKLKAAEQKHLP